MRLLLLIATAMLLAACDKDAKSGPAADAGVTLKLPPALPATDEASAEPAPAAAEEAAAAEEPAPPGEPRLVPASPPIAQASLARYIDRSGFTCDEVVTVSRLERPDGSRAGIYKFDCETGGSYQGTMKQNHLYFRPWEGIPG